VTQLASAATLEVIFLPALTRNETLMSQPKQQMPQLNTVRIPSEKRIVVTAVDAAPLSPSQIILDTTLQANGEPSSGVIAKYLCIQERKEKHKSASRIHEDKFCMTHEFAEMIVT
jgi:hypothetical protein